MYHEIKRTVCDVGMMLDFPAGEEIPIRLRDDMDPYCPPMEYACGRVSWSGYGSKQQRDEARRSKAAAQIEAAAADALKCAKARAARVERMAASAFRTAKTCRHQRVKTSAPGGFSSSVAVYPYTEENQAAHGNICVTEHCPDCLCAREKNLNGGYAEFGLWGPDWPAIEKIS